MSTTETLKRMPYGMLCAGLMLLSQSLNAQAIPLELTGGHRYATINLVFARNLAGTSKFGFFHLSTLTANYDDGAQDDLTAQDLLFFEPVGNFRLTAGAFYGGPGFNPTVGMQYVRGGRSSFILVAPRLNIESDPSFSVFSIVRFKPQVIGNTRLYLGGQMLNLFDADSHIKSYQWLRVGAEINGNQFGFAFNIDEFGPQPDVKVNAGLFLRREIP